jgi:hypothetical protein
MIKGAIHIHSTYSDGEFSLRELRDILVNAGCAFACTTDHADAFNPEKLNHYAGECAALSDQTFRFVPGLEFGCIDRMHILGYGVTSLVNTQDPQEVIRHIESNGGISVIAHPKDAAFPWIETFQILPSGIEIWNSKYDGRYAPRPGTIALLGRLQQRKSDLHAFYGQDLHWKKQFRGLFNLVDCSAPVREEILRAFRQGNYFGVKDEIELPSSGTIPEELLNRFAVVHGRSDLMRNFIKGAKKFADRLGVRVPASIKAQLRRIF